jgi:hypothetical protein
MKTYFYIATIALLITGLSANAAIWRVNNYPGINADFTNLQEAINGANEGDTIYVEGSPFTYTPLGDNFTINKRLIIIGPGYFLGDNDTTLYNNASAKIHSIMKFIEGSEGSIFQGMQVNDYLYIETNNITVQRNYSSSIVLGKSGITIQNPIIKQNYIGGHIGQNGDVTNGIIYNNIIKGNALGDQSGCISLHSTSSSFSILFNITTGGAAYVNSIQAYNSIIGNNICYYDIYTGCDIDGIWTTANNTLSNNILELGLDFEAQFIESTVYDKRYQLAPGSAAIGAASDGGDCGAFGGVEPYILSGLPPIPHIWDINAPVSVSDDSELPVIIKVKTQN